MLVPFESLNDNSRVWIYQANRRLTDAEVARLAVSLENFCKQWMAHGEPLKTGFRIEHNQFVVLCADEDYHAPSGCSIDTSVRTLKEFQAGINADFFDRTLVAFLVDGNVTTAKLSELPGKFKSSVFGAATVTFNNLTPSKGDFLRSWLEPVEKTWLAKYLGTPALSSKG